MLITEELSKFHDRMSFFCGVPSLDGYLKQQVNQDISRFLTKCFVLPVRNSNTIKGYYTLSTFSIEYKDIPEEHRAKLPKSYSKLPCVLLGRLAIDSDFKGKGIGKVLMIDAIKRSIGISKTVGLYAIVVEPLDENVKLFYQRFGFKNVENSDRMYLLVKTAIKFFIN